MGVHEAKIEKSSRGFSLRFPSKDSHKKIIIIIIKNKNKKLWLFYPKYFAFQTITRLLHTNCYIANKKQPVF
jgi:hypothetical protein